VGTDMRLIDPAACSDTVTKLELRDGQTGFIFMLSKLGDSKAALMSFFGTGSKNVKRHKGRTTFPSIECTLPPTVVPMIWLLLGHVFL
jgi:hypothetical protein